MSTVKWHAGPMDGLDTETTGTDPYTDRIVTAAVVHVAPGLPTRTTQWLIHPGRDIPTEAADVHGWTTERVEQTLAGAEAARIVDGGQTPLSRESALFEIVTEVAKTIGAGIPLVVANASFDLTLLETELARAGIDTLTSRPKGIAGVVDPMVIEKQFDPYRKVKGGCRGGRRFRCGGCGTEDKKLSSLCKHYHLQLTDAHDAAADALGALRLAWKLAQLWPEIGRWRLETLHNHQIEWRREQMKSLRKYFDDNDIEHDGCDGSWPLLSNIGRPIETAQLAGALL